MTALLWTTLLACSSNKQFPTTAIDVAGKSVTVELAVNTKDRAQGLMHRKSMPTDEGMLFIYPDQKPRSFWMKNTLIPLSIAFIDRDGKIVKIADMEPLVTQSTKSIYPAKYALEMNKGWFDTHGIAKGAVVTGIPNDAEAKVE